MGTRVATSLFPDKNLTGVSQLLEDLQRLAEDHESADIVFLLGREEVPVYAHRIMLMARERERERGNESAQFGKTTAFLLPFAFLH
ncbi:hypothetical protein RUM44_003206 [Polyplax serrata]|uniref:BTB domain-containing protein n=1 Tax=Polyplax serrata TaxID=468196 RepID=A0ABR1AXV2_POLSC